MASADPQQEQPAGSGDVAKTFLQVAGEKLPAPMLLVLLLLFLIIVWGVTVDGNLLYLLLLLPVLGVGAWIWWEWQQGKERERQAQREHERLMQQEARQFELEKERLRRQAPEKADEPEGQKESTPAEAETESPAQLERRYLEWVAGRCELLSMEAVDKTATRPDAAKVALNKVFTQVDVLRPLAHDEKTEPARQQDPEERREPAIAVIGDPAHKYLVLLGQPGSGKSTLVDYIALCLAGQVLQRPGDSTLDELEKQKWTLRWRLPVRVILREYAEQGLRQNLSLWQFISHELAKPAATNRNLAAYVSHLQQQLQEQGGMLLLDGLDEVPDAHAWREQLRQEILNFAADFRQVRILVTGRPYAYDKPEWQLPGFERVELLDFNEAQMFAYVDRRYALMAGSDSGLDQAQAAAYAQELKQQIQERQALRDLAARPLLLALITSLHHWRGGRSLPADREKLYDESVDLLIDLWQQRKRLPEVNPLEAGAHELTHLLGVGPVELRDALSKVAFEVHRDQPKLQGTADVPAAKLAGALHEVLDPHSNITPRQIIHYVQNRAGLLEERDGTVPGREIYAFAHRTFQEYLAGCYLLTQDDFADAAARLARPDPERWREALLLAARRDKNPTPAWDLVDALCQPATAPQPGEVVSEEAWWGAFLAGQILLERDLWVDPPERRRPVVSRVQAWLVALLGTGALTARDRALAGQTLAQIGDPRQGVGIDPHTGLPDIVWGGQVPAGDYTIGDEKPVHNYEALRPAPITSPYHLARYPITNTQFQCFVEADDVDDDRWWQGMPAGQQYKERINQPRWSSPNRPRESVTWYQAVAFCRWLEHHYRKAGLLGAGEQIDLPHEYEWEVAARYAGNGQCDGRTYPWGNEAITPSHANYDNTGLGETSAVGIFPAGQQPELHLYDLSGNVWEWCRNKYRNTDDTAVDESGDARILRGGSWAINPDLARAAFRLGSNPHTRYANHGFRVVVRRPPSHPER